MASSLHIYHHLTVITTWWDVKCRCVMTGWKMNKRPAKEKQTTTWSTGSHTITYLYLKYVLKCIKWVVITQIQPPSDYHTWLSLRSELQSLFRFVSLWQWANPASGCLPATGSASFMPKHVCVPGRRELSGFGIARRQGNLGGDFITMGSAGGERWCLRCSPYKSSMSSGLPQHWLPHACTAYSDSCISLM